VSKPLCPSVTLGTGLMGVSAGGVNPSVETPGVLDDGTDGPPMSVRSLGTIIGFLLGVCPGTMIFLSGTVR